MAKTREMVADPVARELIVRMLIDRRGPVAINNALRVAGKPSISKTALYVTWSKMDEVVEGRRRASEAVVRLGVGDRESRVMRLQEMLDNVETVFAERGTAMAGLAPGGRTGLLVQDTKAIGSGENARVVSVFRADTGLLREYRELLRQMAIELGEWSERREVTGANGGPIEVAALSPQQRAARIAELLSRGEGRNVYVVDGTD